MVSPFNRGEQGQAARTPLISVIVPIFKVEAYLCDCLDSILSQTYHNIEVILVDDGSPDACGSICDRYALTDERVVALHKENGGLSDARNYGLRHAHGEWISFVDSDDFISPIFIQTLFEAATEWFCAIAAVPGGKDFVDGDECRLIGRDDYQLDPMVKRRKDADEIEMSFPMVAKAYDASEMLKRMLYQEVATGAQWRLYRRDVLGEDPFPVGIYYEDLASTYRFIHRAERVALVDCRELYAYRLRSTSIIRQEFTPIKAESALMVARQLCSDISNWYPDLADAASSRCFSVCRMVFAQLPSGKRSTDDERRYRDDLWAELKSHRLVILKDKNARKRERLAALIACFGMHAFQLFCYMCRRLGLLR